MSKTHYFDSVTFICHCSDKQTMSWTYTKTYIAGKKANINQYIANTDDGHKEKKDHYPKEGHHKSVILQIYCVALCKMAAITSRSQSHCKIFNAFQIVQSVPEEQR